jgi:hypothetical protein
MNRIEAVKLKEEVLARVRKAFTPLVGEHSDIEIFRETAGQIILRSRNPGPSGSPVMLMVTVTELRSWK